MIDATLLRNYVTNRRKDVGACEAALLAADWALVEGVGHRIAGSSATFGFPELSSVGETLEAAARAGDETRLREALSALRKWVDENAGQQADPFIA